MFPHITTIIDLNELHYNIFGDNHSSNYFHIVFQDRKENHIIKNDMKQAADATK